jgi:predicted CopG family antitoxin
MTKTVRVPDEYHEWLKSHKREDETMGETIRRLTHAPPPAEAVLTDEEADGMREAIARRREAGRGRRARIAERMGEIEFDDSGETG